MTAQVQARQAIHYVEIYKEEAMRWYRKACCWLLVIALGFAAWVAWRSHRYPAITEELAGRVTVGMDLTEVERILGPARDESYGTVAKSDLRFYPPFVMDYRFKQWRHWITEDLVVAVYFDSVSGKVAFVERWRPETQPCSIARRTWNAVVRSFGEDRTEPLTLRAESGRIHTTITGGIIGKRKKTATGEQAQVETPSLSVESRLAWERAGFRPGMMGDAYPFHFLDADEPRARPGLLSFQAYRWPEDFSKLPPPPQLIGLDLSMFRDADGEPKGEITDKHLKELLKLKNIERLSICGAKVTAEGWKHVSDMRELRALCLIGGKLDAAALTHLGAMQNLEKLFAIEVETDERELGHLRNLRRLDLHATKSMSAGGIMKLAALPRLAHLTIKIDQIEPSLLAQFKYLTKLNLSFSRLAENGLKDIGALKGLRSLDLSAVKGNEANIRAVANMPNLEELSLAETPVTDETLKHLASLKSLRRLDLSGTQVTDKGLEHLGSFPNLIDVELSLPEFSKGAIDALKMTLPKLRFQDKNQGKVGV